MAVSVLIVEDDRNIAELLQMYLEKEGYAVTVANDGGQGLAKYRAIKPDLVLLDVMMPVMDGWSVCKAIRAEAQTPIIMLTAKGETDDKVAGLKSGADDYVTKPFEMKEVLARIEAVLRRTSGVTAEMLKAPEVPRGTPVVNALSKQRECIINIFRACIGLQPDNHMMLEYKKQQH